MIESIAFDILVALLGFLVTMVVDVPFAYSEGFFFGAPHGVSWRQLLNSLRVGLSVAVAEEFLFRCLIFGGLLMILPVWAAVLISAALFGLSHAIHKWSITMQVMAGVEGAIGALAYYYTGSLLVPILIHGFVVASWLSFWGGRWKNV